MQRPDLDAIMCMNGYGAYFPLFERQTYKKLRYESVLSISDIIPDVCKIIMGYECYYGQRHKQIPPKKLPFYLSKKIDSRPCFIDLGRNVDQEFSLRVHSNEEFVVLYVSQYEGGISIASWLEVIKK